VDYHAETLEEAWFHALAVDAELAAARLMVLAQKESIGAAKALRAPNVSLGSSYQIRTDEQSVVTPPQPLVPSPNSFPYIQDEGALVGGMISIPVYTSGYIASSVRAAQGSELSAQQIVHRLELDLRSLVAANFIAVLESEQMVQVAKKNLQSLEEHLKNVEALYGNQVASLTDVLDARSARADARQRCLRTENERLLAKAEYNRRLGRPLPSPVHLREPALELANLDLQSLFNLALAKRPELTQMNYEAEVLRQKADAIEAMKGPQVFLGGTYWLEENRYRTPEDVGSLGVTALWNIYDGGQRTHERASLLHEAAAIERRRLAQSQEIELQIHRTWLRRAEVEQLIAEMADAVRLAEENRNSVRQRYQVGMATNAEVLDAEATRIQSLERLHRARYAAILAEIQLRAAAGML
jgi:outer membrane protein TolC